MCLTGSLIQSLFPSWAEGGSERVLASRGQSAQAGPMRPEARSPRGRKLGHGLRGRRLTCALGHLRAVSLSSQPQDSV